MELKLKDNRFLCQVITDSVMVQEDVKEIIKRRDGLNRQITDLQAQVIELNGKITKAEELGYDGN